MIDPKTLTPPNSNLEIPAGSSASQRGSVIVRYVKSLYAQYCIVDWRFGFDKAKRRAGCCRYSNRTITLSTFFALHNTAEEIQGTIVHEIAHALAGHSAGHGPEWRRIAIAMGDDGHRCYDSAKVVMPEGKFLYVCLNCQKEIRKHKRYRAKTACGTCCKAYNRGRFTEKYLLVYKGIGTSTPKPVQAPVAAPSTPVSTGSKTKSQRMIELYDQGTTSVSEIAKIVGAHYSHVHTVIKKHKANQ